MKTSQVKSIGKCIPRNIIQTCNNNVQRRYCKTKEYCHCAKYQWEKAEIKFTQTFKDDPTVNAHRWLLFWMICYKRMNDS